jgi:secondary thiamine-phosphate synthase enzyme
MQELTIHTKSRIEMTDITDQIRKLLQQNPIDCGLCHIFVPHTTAAVTINENADPDVPKDLIQTLERLVPYRGSYHHAEGNADAHIKTMLTGNAVLVPVNRSRLILGTWQSIFFCEYDGPRTRKILVTFFSSQSQNA